ncbi:MAG: acyl-CoA dehydratase activase-related protein [Bacillota bacterium]|nr:acyl-CoA dehydratase activase-related protein [Bacillota bacterium]
MAATAGRATVGIPRTLFHFTFFPLWRRFLEDLGARVVSSSPSSKPILDAGVKAAVGDACVPIKLMHGHVIDLVQKGVDWIFLPRLICTNGRTVYCPKFLGLPDMIAASVETLPPIIDARYDARRGRAELRRWALAVGRHFTDSEPRILAALRAGQAEQRRYEERIRQGLDPEAAAVPDDASACVCGAGTQAEVAAVAATANETDRASAVAASVLAPLRLAVIGYPYVVHDPFINLNLLAKLRRLGAEVLTTQSVSPADLAAQRAQLGKDLFWTYSEEAVCAGFHYLGRPDLVDGVIHLTAFGCGPDSVADKLLELKAQELANVPFMSLMIDEHTGEAGILTRLEAFTDMAWRRRVQASPPSATARAQVVCSAPPMRVRRRFARRPRKVTFPYLGAMPEVFGDLFRTLGNEVVMPPRPSRRTLTLGTAHAPEFACLPFKILLGTYLETIEMGADTIISTGGVGPCRAGLYTELHERILRRLGFDVEVVTLEPPRADLADFIGKVAALNPRGLPVWRVAQEVWRVFRKAKALDDLERLSHRVRAREAVRGSTTPVYRAAIAEVHRAHRKAEIAAGLWRGRELLGGVATRPGFEPLRAGIVGEIYVLVEPSSNFEIEETLGELGVETERSIYVGGWAAESNLLGSPGTGRNETAAELARPYLAEMIGGHGQGSVGHALMFARAGFDGVIQLAPFTCIPEIVAKAVLERVSREIGIPVLSLSLDELTGKAGLLTRLEAFRDLLGRRREARRGEARRREASRGTPREGGR